MPQVYFGLAQSIPQASVKPLIFFINKSNFFSNALNSYLITTTKQNING